MAGKLVVVGSSNIDLVMKMARLPKVGETVTDATFVQAFGGKGANQAVGAARAGGEVVFVSCVGDDAYGAQVRGSLEADGIDTRFVFTEAGVASGTALILVGGGGENYISVAPGANYRLTPAHVDRAREAIGAAAMVIGQCEILPETLDHVIAVGAELGKPVMLNLAPARRIADASLARLAYLAVNETEAEFLTGRRIESDEDVEAAVEALLAKGPRTVVLTLGARGRLRGRRRRARARPRLHGGGRGHDRGRRRPLRRARGGARRGPAAPRGRPLRERGRGSLGHEARRAAAPPPAAPRSTRSCAQATTADACPHVGPGAGPAWTRPDGGPT